jgi:hypothetical protein
LHIRIKSLPNPDIIYYGDNHFVVKSDYQFSIYINGELKCFTIPEGFDFDGKSVYKIIEVLTLGYVKRRDDRYFKEVLIHDWFYEFEGIVFTDEGEKICYTRADADKIYRKSMKFLNRSWLRRWVEFVAVRIGGKFVW